MTDFLTALLDRTLHRAPVLERRLPSLFETAAVMEPEPGPLIEEALDEIEAAAPARRSNPGPPEETDLSVPTAARREAPTSPEKERAFPRAEPSPTIERARMPEVAHAPQAATRGEPVVMERVVESKERILEREIEVVRQVTSSMPQGEAWREGARAVNPPPPEPRPRPGKPERGEEPAARREPVRNVFDTRAAAHLPKPAGPTPLAALAFRRAARTGSGVFQEPQPQPAEPTIHVTIGRVEIRATPVPPKAAASKPVRPKLQLEDYLRARSGGHS